MLRSFISNPDSFTWELGPNGWKKGFLLFWKKFFETHSKYSSILIIFYDQVMKDRI
jgi:hypothetical protein